MSTRRWRDPRDGRSWEVSVSRVSRIGGAEPLVGSRNGTESSGPPADPAASVSGRATVCFDLLTTPRRAFSVTCSVRAEGLFPRMRDQELALCLDAARRGGRIWVDPRDGELWWVQCYGRPQRAGSSCASELPVVFQSIRSAVGAQLETPRWIGELDDSELASILDGGELL